MKFFLKLLPLLIFLFIVYWEFLRPKLKTENSSLNGEVVNIIKYKRGGGYLIEINEKGKIRYLSYSFLDNVFDIDVGDSVFKESASKILFVKSISDSILRKANFQGFKVYP